MHVCACVCIKCIFCLKTITIKPQSYAVHRLGSWKSQLDVHCVSRVCCVTFVRPLPPLPSHLRHVPYVLSAWVRWSSEVYVGSNHGGHRWKGGGQATLRLNQELGSTTKKQNKASQKNFRCHQREDRVYFFHGLCKGMLFLNSKPHSHLSDIVSTLSRLWELLGPAHSERSPVKFGPKLLGERFQESLSRSQYLLPLWEAMRDKGTGLSRS